MRDGIAWNFGNICDKTSNSKLLNKYLNDRGGTEINK